MPSRYPSSWVSRPPAWTERHLALRRCPTSEKSICKARKTSRLSPISPFTLQYRWDGFYTIAPFISWLAGPSRLIYWPLKKAICNIASFPPKEHTQTLQKTGTTKWTTKCFIETYREKHWIKQTKATLRPSKSTLRTSNPSRVKCEALWVEYQNRLLKNKEKNKTVLQTFHKFSSFSFMLHMNQSINGHRTQWDLKTPHSNSNTEVLSTPRLKIQFWRPTRSQSYKTLNI